ncbi:hypothetical protein LEP1GSC173_3088 [Leptospira interrogans str. HAI1594]|nr:hypothetical protein LEP1GSC173_3088 [Leptospira interrogans str. HAI1594]
MLKKSIIATSRKMIEVLYVMIRTGKLFDSMPENILNRKINSIWSYVKKITGGLDTRNIGESVVLSFPIFGWGVVRFGKFFSIRKTYFLQVKRLILVGTLEKCAFLSPERRSIESPFC